MLVVVVVCFRWDAHCSEACSLGRSGSAYANGRHRVSGVHRRLLVRIALAPRVTRFRLPHHDRPDDALPRHRRLAEWFRQLGMLDPLPTVVDLEGPVFPLTDQSLAFRGPIASLPRLQLQPATFIADYPVIADQSFARQPKALTQFAGCGFRP
jgi:hypothetical protein